jgi:hypothetical protein
MLKIVGTSYSLLSDCESGTIECETETPPLKEIFQKDNLGVLIQRISSFLRRLTFMLEINVCEAV